MLRKPKNYLFRGTFIGLFVLLIIGFCLFLFQNSRSSRNSLGTKVSPIVSPLYTVQKVIDGDTIDVVIDGKKERVRLIGIDAPEMAYEEKQADCFAKESTMKLKELVEGKPVQLLSDPTQDDQDSYSRLLRYVFFKDGTLVNRLMISKGFARQYTYMGISYQYQKDFREAELEAQKNKLGMWAEGICPVMIQ